MESSEPIKFNNVQIPLFHDPQPLIQPQIQPQIQKLLEMNIESMTPIEAITKLFELQQESKNLQDH